MKNFLLLFSLFFICFSCNQESSADTTEGKTSVQEKAYKYKLTPFTASPEFPDAKISSLEYKNGTFNFGIDASTYELGAQTSDAPQKMCANSAKGQHIHLIVDNAPYAAKYVSSFDYDVEDGEHFLLAFLSRSYHESIKTDAAHVAYKTTVKNKSIEKVEEITKPMIFYSRPKGTYVDTDTEKVMLDFYPVNADLGKVFRVLATINGEEHLLDKWQPYYIEGLPMGENTITLTLVDDKGLVIDTPLNPVSRTFVLVKSEPK